MVAVTTRSRLGGCGVRRGYWLRLGAAALLATLILGLICAFGYLPYVWASTVLHPPRHPARATPAALGLEYEDVTFAAHGVDLHGWYVPGAGEAAIVLVHGIGNERSTMLPVVAALHAAGFDLLLYDQRGSGRSGGDMVTLGYLEAGDLAAAADYLRERSGAPLVGAYGISMGASVALLAAAQGPGLDAVAADSPYADLYRLVAEGAPVRLFKLGAVLGPLWRGIAPMMLWHAERQSGISSDSVRPVDSIAQVSPRPVFLIHGTQDQLFGPHHSVALFEAAREPRALWLLPGANHAGLRPTPPADYDARLVDFFRHALLADSGAGAGGRG
jgi:uncharacterized protein